MEPENFNKLNNEKEIAILQKLSSIGYEERKKVNITREILTLLAKLYANGDLDELCPQLIDNESNKIDISYFNIVGQDLSGFDFSNFLLRYCNFSRSKFDEEVAQTVVYRAKEEKVKLTEADFSNANYALRKVHNSAIGMDLRLPYNFSNLNLTKASFARADLTGANFKEAILVGVNFSFAILNQASFVQADIAQANFENAVFYPEQFIEVNNFDQANFGDQNIIEVIQSLRGKTTKTRISLASQLILLNQKLKNVFKTSILFSLFSKMQNVKSNSDLNKVNPAVSNNTVLTQSHTAPNVEKKSFVAKISGSDNVKTQHQDLNK